MENERELKERLDNNNCWCFGFNKNIELKKHQRFHPRPGLVKFRLIRLINSTVNFSTVLILIIKKKNITFNTQN